MADIRWQKVVRLTCNVAIVAALVGTDLTVFLEIKVHVVCSCTMVMIMVVCATPAGKRHTATRHGQF